MPWLRALVLLAALAMPLIGWLSQRAFFGPDNATISARYPTLIVPLGAFFSIWGLIFTLDLVWAVRQWRRPASAGLDRARLALAIGFGATALWMVVFSLQWFWVSMAVMLLALAGLLIGQRLAEQRFDATLALHGGWLTLATFLNVGQLGVAQGLWPFDRSLPGNVALLGAALAVALAVNHSLRGRWFYASGVAWGLLGCALAQGQRSTGEPALAALAWVGLALVLLQTGWWRGPQTLRN